MKAPEREGNVTPQAAVAAEAFDRGIKEDMRGLEGDPFAWSVPMPRKWRVVGYSRESARHV